MATREDAEGYNRLLSTLVEANRQWAQQAPVLILAVAKLDFDHVARPNRHAFYDLGQAVANLTVSGDGARFADPPDGRIRPARGTRTFRHSRGL